jgi:hypothetical protein
MDGFKWVLMKQNARPRNCRKLLEGETYYLPTEIADRLIEIGWAEETTEPVPDEPAAVSPRKAPQPGSPLSTWWSNSRS